MGNSHSSEETVEASVLSPSFISQWKQLRSQTQRDKKEGVSGGQGVPGEEPLGNSEG